MSLANIALNQILGMFIIIFIGIVSYKVKLIDEDTNKKLSNILLNLVLPLVIFVSYQRDSSPSLLKGLFISLVLAFATHIIGILISTLLIHRNRSDGIIERFACIYSNCAFMGIPIVSGIFGTEGVFYITAYMTAFNIFVWTHGVIMMTGRQEPKAMAKTLVSPTILAIILGMVFFVLQIRIPNIVFESLNSIASVNTPFAMLIAGVTIGQTNSMKLFGKLRIYYVAFIKLLLIPIILLFLYSRFSMDKTVLTTAILAAACPTAATGTLFALRYDKNALYASEIFAITSLLSMLTIPLVMALTEFITK